MAKAPIELKKKYDLIVIGSGPGGQRAAIQAAKLKKSVLVVEKDHMGGSCLHTGTIPSKTLREAASIYQDSGPNTLTRVMAQKNLIIEQEQEVIGMQMERNSVQFIQGTASFLSSKKIAIKTTSKVEDTEADFIILATGSRPVCPPHIPFNDKNVFNSDSVLSMNKLPDTMAVLGAGVIGCEYASIFAKLGVKVTLLDRRNCLLRSVDQEIVGLLAKHFDENNISVRLGITLGKVSLEGDKVAIELGDKTERFSSVLYCMGRDGNIEDLNLPKVGISPEKGNTLKVNAHYQTNIPHIYAVGDLIGFPALAASSSEQGRLASAHAFGLETTTFPETFPYGIYTIPEISSVGLHEEELNTKQIKFVSGKARYKELARGKILEDESGFLKLLVDCTTRKILGVHIIGTHATELVHIGQVAMSLGATIDFFVANVFNYPTLAEAYKVAAYHAHNQLRELK